MKTLVFFILFISTICSQSINDSSIYFENFESIEFEIKDDLRILTFSFNNDEGFSKAIVIRQGIDDYVFSTITDEGVSNPIYIHKSSVKSMIPTLVKYYVDDITKEKLNKVINLIY